MAGPFVKVEAQNEAFLVTWSRGEGLQHAAFAHLDEALAFGQAFIGMPLKETRSLGSSSYWMATR